MKGCRLFASALCLQAFIVLGAFAGATRALAADEVSSSSVVSEDIPKAAADLQKMISTLGLNVTPCSAPDPVGADPLICSDPVKAICGSQSADERTHREQLIESFKQIFLAKVRNQIQLKSQDPVEAENQAQTQFQVERELDIMADNLEIIEKLLFELLRDKGWSKESVKKIFERAKAIELSKIRPGDTIHSNRVKALISAPWLTSEVIRKLPLEQREKARMAMVTACGVDALSSDAFAAIISKTSEKEADMGMDLDAGKSAAFIICPGLILYTALSDLGPDSLVYPVGHELGHILQPVSPVQGTQKIEFQGDKDRDGAYLRCLKMNDRNEMNDTFQQIAAFEKLNEAEAKTSLLTRLSVSQYVEFKKHELDEFKKKWGREPDSIDLHQNELMADYWGGQVLAEIVKNMPDLQSRKAVLISNFTALCQSQITHSKETDIKVHPPSGYRIQRILSNPEIRASLSCKSPPPRVWCER
jgi:hypothetical protein